MTCASYKEIGAVSYGWERQVDSAASIQGWIGTLGGGVSVLNVADGRFTRYRYDPDDPQSLSNDTVLSFYEDPTGTVWIATFGGGLDRFDRATQVFTHCAESDALANASVYAILADSRGFL